MPSAPDSEDDEGTDRQSDENAIGTAYRLARLASKIRDSVRLDLARAIRGRADDEPNLFHKKQHRPLNAVMPGNGTGKCRFKPALTPFGDCW
jgi:hypothetical protein